MFAKALLGLLLMASTTTEAAEAGGAEIVPAEAVAVVPVVLLHGLARSSKSMNKLATFLEKNGYEVCNVDYPSTKFDIETLVDSYVLPAIAACIGEAKALNFVTHSMGGILVRQIAQRLAEEAKPAFSIERAVMLSPPNHGSEVVDKLGDWGPFQWLNGPAGSELSTAMTSKPNTLGDASFEVGVITGNQSINWILSTLIPGDDDGKVSVESAKLEGMAAFKIMPATHTFIMQNKAVLKETLHFLQHGLFLPN